MFNVFFIKLKFKSTYLTFLLLPYIFQEANRSKKIALFEVKLEVTETISDFTGFLMANETQQGSLDF